jgi:hypothetical protein
LQAAIRQLAGYQFANEDRAVLASQAPFIPYDLPACEALELFGKFGKLIGVQDLRDRESSEFVEGISKHFASSRVSVQIPPLGIRHENAIQDLFGKPTIPFLAGVQLALPIMVICQVLKVLPVIM